MLRNNLLNRWLKIRHAFICSIFNFSHQELMRILRFIRLLIAGSNRKMQLLREICSQRSKFGWVQWLKLEFFGRKRPFICICHWRVDQKTCRILVRTFSKFEITRPFEKCDRFAFFDSFSWLWTLIKLTSSLLFCFSEIIVN